MFCTEIKAVHVYTITHVLLHSKHERRQVPTMSKNCHVARGGYVTNYETIQMSNYLRDCYFPLAHAFTSSVRGLIHNKCNKGMGFFFYSFIDCAFVIVRLFSTVYWAECEAKGVHRRHNKLCYKSKNTFLLRHTYLFGTRVTQNSVIHPKQCL